MPIRILLADDHQMMRDGLRAILEQESGLEVVAEARTGRAAVDLVKEKGPEVVVMDIGMPQLNGIEATRQLRRRHPDLKVVVLSSIGDQHLARAIEAGATGYMLKTATRDELVQAVVQAAGGQSPIDPKLTPSLLHHMRELSRAARHRLLSSRQREILRLVADGVPSREITTELSVSQATLKREMRHIFDQLGVDDRAHAIAEAYRRNLL